MRSPFWSRLKLSRCKNAINPSEFDKLLDIQIKTETPVKAGSFDTTWPKDFDILAKVENKTGNERFGQQKLSTERTLLVTTHYRDDIFAKENRISFEGNIYDITFVDNVDYKNEYLKITALLDKDADA